MLKKLKYSETIKKYAMTTLGCALVGTESIFLIHHKIVTGGFSGIANILYHAYGLPPGLVVFVMNIIALAISFKTFGKKFVFDSIIGSALLSGFLQLFLLLPPVTENILLSTIFGCILSGAGAGLVLAAEATTGGTDIIARLVQLKLPHLPIGKILSIVSGLIILSGLIVFKTVDLALYGFLAMIIYTFVIDMIFNTLNNQKLLFIVTDKRDELVAYINLFLQRGATIIEATGGLQYE